MAINVESIEYDWIQHSYTSESDFKYSHTCRISSSNYKKTFNQYFCIFKIFKHSYDKVTRKA